jgi:hypothetical protein
MLKERLEQCEDMMTLTKEIRDTCHSSAGLAEEFLAEREKAHSLAVQNKMLQEEIAVARGCSSQRDVEEQMHSRGNSNHVSYAPSHTSPAMRGALALRSVTESAIGDGESSPSMRTRGGGAALPLSARSHTRSYSEQGGQRQARSERSTGSFVGASSLAGGSLGSSPRKRPPPILATTSPKANPGAYRCAVVGIDAGGRPGIGGAGCLPSACLAADTEGGCMSAQTDNR